MCEHTCVRACCVRIHVFWLCGCRCVLAVRTRIRARTHRGKVERRSCFLLFYTAAGHAYASSSQCISTIVSLLFFLGGGGGGICISIFSANMHRDLFLSGLTAFPTKCPTSPAVIPGPSIARRLQSPLPSLCLGRETPLPQPLLAVGALLWVSVPCFAASLHIEM